MAYVLKNQAGQIAHAIAKDAPAGTPAIRIIFKTYQEAFNFRAAKGLIGWRVVED